MDADRGRVLRDAAQRHGTPCYVYFADEIAARAGALKRAFGGRFELSYAVKCNPNRGVLHTLQHAGVRLDVSSGGELARALKIGQPGDHISFSGPAKRGDELRAAVAAGCELVCESEHEIRQLDAASRAAGKRAPFLIRLNPARMPRKFGVSMAGRASQFGVDEEDADGVLKRIGGLAHVAFRGFHIYSGTNCLDEDALAENFAIFIELFRRFSAGHDLTPAKLIFGSGFGIPYFDGEKALDLDRLAARLNPMLDALAAEPRFAHTQLALELGRYLVGPAGYLVTSVIGAKRSRGTEIRLCDAGFNHHINVCGLMGTVIRRNWPFWNLSAAAEAPRARYMLAGPLCTAIDVLAPQIELPAVNVGDVLAVGASGAYGLTASPTGFISHPPAREVLVTGTASEDVSELAPATVAA